MTTESASQDGRDNVIVQVKGDNNSVLVHRESKPRHTPLDPFATVPPLPANFIDRPEISEPLIGALLSNAETVGLTALEGMGGVGKTIAALSLCYDPRIRDAYPDGIVWLTIGKEASVPLEKRVEKVAAALNQEFRNYSEAAYQSLFKGKAVLVVLDDVWTLDAVEPFCLGPGLSRLLYTSRNRELAGSLGADNYEVGVLQEAETRLFLARWSGRDPDGLPEPYGTEILAECKGLILGLAMIGAALKGQPDREWARTLASLKKPQPQLKRIGRRPGGYAYETLHASIGASVDVLDPSSKARYLQLAVLLEDMAAPEVLLQSIWGGRKEDVQGTTRLLVDRSLASRDADDSIRLHDFQLDFVRSEYPDPAALALQHSAMLRSVHVVRSHPEQFAFQMIGRLLAHEEEPGVATFIKHLDECAKRPRLRPLRYALESAGGPALRVLETHTAFVNPLALTADGSWAVSGCHTGILRVWDLVGNQPPLELKGHTDWVTSVALTASGGLTVSGSDDRTLRVWDLAGNKPTRVLEGHTAPVTSVALSSDGRLAVSSSDKTILVWDLTGKKRPRVLNGHTAQVTSVALTSNGLLAVSGSEDKTLRVWDLECNQPPRILEGHTAPVTSVALTAEGGLAVSGSHDKTLRVWDLASNQLSRVLEGHTDLVTSVALMSDGRRAVSGSYDKTLRVWDLAGNQPPRVLEGHIDWVTSVALTPDGRLGVSSSDDKTLRVWDLAGNQPPRILSGHAGWVNSVVLTSGRRAVSGSRDKTLRVWDLAGNQPPRVLKGHTEWVTSVALTSDGRLAVSGSHDKTLRVWDLAGDHPTQVLKTGSVTSVALTSDGRLAVSSSDKTLRIWDLVGKERPRVLKGHTGLITSVALTPDGRLAVSGSHDRTLRVWDLAGNQPPRVLKGHTKWVTSVALTSDGRLALSGSYDKTLRVWDLAGNQPPRVLEGHQFWVNSVALTPDGRLAVSGSPDKTLRVWDLEEGGCLEVFICDASVLSCSTSGKHIATGDEGGQVSLYLWKE